MGEIAGGGQRPDVRVKLRGPGLVASASLDSIGSRSTPAFTRFHRLQPGPSFRRTWPSRIIATRQSLNSILANSVPCVFRLVIAVLLLRQACARCASPSITRKSADCKPNLIVPERPRAALAGASSGPFPCSRRSGRNSEPRGAAWAILRAQTSIHALALPRGLVSKTSNGTGPTPIGKTCPARNGWGSQGTDYVRDHADSAAAPQPTGPLRLVPASGRANTPQDIRPRVLQNQAPAFR